MKTIYSAICLLLVLLCGCGTLSGSRKSENPSDKTQDLVGTWTLRYATNVSDGAEYPLQKVYGTGIQYGGELTLHPDRKFSRYVGIHSGETEHYEGTYTVSGSSITFRYHDGTVGKARYDEKKNQILYITPLHDEGEIYEHYKKDDYVLCRTGYFTTLKRRDFG